MYLENFVNSQKIKCVGMYVYIFKSQNKPFSIKMQQIRTKYAQKRRKRNGRRNMKMRIEHHKENEE